MTRKYPIEKLMHGKGQKNAKKLCKANKNNKKEHNFMLHIEKILKLSRSKKAFHQRALKSLCNIKDSASTYEMALTFDNLYVEDSKSVNGKDLKFQSLKELNLIHLDLLQQQADQINDRDKRIRVLEEENKNLKARLERIDRRVSLTISKKVGSVESLTVDTYIPEEQSQLVECERQPSRLLPIRNSITKPTAKSNLPNKVSLDDGTDSQKLSPNSAEPNTLLFPNISQILRTSPREKKIKKDSLDTSGEGLDIDCGNKVNSEKFIINEPKGVCKKAKLSSDVEETTDNIKKHITDHSLRSRYKQKDFNLNDTVSETVSESPNTIVIETLHHQIQPSSPLVSETVHQTILEGKCENTVNEVWSSLRNSLLTTDVPYFLSTIHHPFKYSLHSTEENSLEIPKWRVRSILPLYVMEGTENLDEDMFGKRHAKPEHDERRRKRWDLQRMREQRQYEKLRKRYDSRHNSPGVRPGSNLSLWPTPDTIMSICVESEIPVCAFGQPLPHVKQDCFYAPWLTKRNHLTPKRKQR